MNRHEHDELNMQLKPEDLMRSVSDMATILICTVCGHDGTEIERVWSLQGQEESQIEDGEIYGVACGGRAQGWGDCLVIRLRCRCGHMFEIWLQQHEGITLVYSRSREREVRR